MLDDEISADCRILEAGVDKLEALRGGTLGKDGIKLSGEKAAIGVKEDTFVFGVAVTKSAKSSSSKFEVGCICGAKDSDGTANVLLLLDVNANPYPPTASSTLCEKIFCDKFCIELV